MSQKLKPPAALSKIFLITSLMISTAAIEGCSSLPVDSSCRSFAPITWSRKDTVPTQRQVIAHNKAYLAICPAPAKLSASNYP
jgi:hypothetical protein